MLVNKQYLLQKFSGKSGWTYALIPEILPNKHAPFGFVTVKGAIDNYTFNKYNLMPFGNGNLFLPVNATVRKKIKKQAGDFVHIILFADNDPLIIPDDFMLCLKNEPDALLFFNALPTKEQLNYIKWINAAKSESLRIDRMAAALLKLNKKRLVK